MSVRDITIHNGNITDSNFMDTILNIVISHSNEVSLAWDPHGKQVYTNLDLMSSNDIL
jgi:hypothetical protein